MRLMDLHVGGRVVSTPEENSLILADHRFLANRRHGLGTVFKPLAGEAPHYCWWVRHTDGTVAPYYFHELESAEHFNPALFPDHPDTF